MSLKLIIAIWLGLPALIYLGIYLKNVYSYKHLWFVYRWDEDVFVYIFSGLFWPVSILPICAVMGYEANEKRIKYKKQLRETVESHYNQKFHGWYE